MTKNIKNTNKIYKRIKRKNIKNAKVWHLPHSSNKMQSYIYKPAYNRASNKSFFLYCIIVYIIASIGIANINHLLIDKYNFIKDIEVEKFKTTINNSLPIINVTYNSGNIGNPISVQLKQLTKSIFGFDISAPISILNVQSPFLQVYYQDTYLPYLANNGPNNAGKEEQDLYINSKGDNYADNNSKNSENTDLVNENDKSDSKNDLASRGDDREKGLRGENIEQVEDGIISYYYYEGEEEKLEPPKENIVSGQKIAIMNMTNYKISLEKDVNKLLKEPLNLKPDREGPKILILHTHTSESFIKNLTDINKKGPAIWSRNSQENVVRIGHELSEQLKKKYGYDVVHNGTEHDSPDYNKSYNNSYQTIDKYLKSYPSIRMVLDIHRDGLGQDQPKLRVVKKIDGKDVAQIMFVVGTDGNGLQHPNWRENLKLALKLQENLNSQQPGLARHIYISNNRYNQHFTNGSLIVEIGGEGNLLSECLESIKYLSKAISEVIK